MKCFHPAFSLSHPFIPKTFFAKPAVSLTDGLFTKNCRECYITTFQWRILDKLLFFSFGFFKDFFET